jgi:DNA-binding NtrC family response regulator
MGGTIAAARPSSHPLGPPQVRGGARAHVADSVDSAPTAASLRGEIEGVERERILAALEACGGNQTQAAKLLGVSRHALLGRIEKYALTRPRKRG